ncbi:hypothetical protein KFL_001230100 [Klebsormidium nitens]|uniref:Uncharacterized protein n=1 Tax=Klebsormidium nitens TaxID=105231 RepID=A0A1Y1HYE3_KLENI|nr:hypothetical protein KFL_001230100 [Klebsormidium nitens]|eukprot:GAQ82762.1 hypothetical protein KFL_001230100 [Klebsormidium nitens]
MQPAVPSTDSPVLRGFPLPSDQIADPSRETAVSFESQLYEAEPPKTPLNPVLTQSTSPSGGTGLAELKGFRLGDVDNPRGTAVSFAAGYQPGASTPEVKTRSILSDVPAPRPLKPPPDQLKRRADADPPVLKGFRLTPDEAHARDAALSFFRGSSPGSEEPLQSPASNPSFGGGVSSFSHPPASHASAVAPKQGGDVESPVLRGFRLPDGGPSSPPTRDAAVSFDGPQSPAVISHRPLLRPVTEDPPSAPDVGLCIVLTADSSPNPSLGNSFNSPKTISPGNTSPAGRSIISRGEGLGGLPKGRLTWNDVINGASEENAGTGKGLGEAGATEAADADCGEESDDVSDGQEEPEGVVFKRVVAEGDDVTLGAGARKGEDDDVSTAEVGSTSESRMGRNDVKLTLDVEKGGFKGVVASGQRMGAEQGQGMKGGGSDTKEDGTAQLQGKSAAASGSPSGPVERSVESLEEDWHGEGEAETEAARGSGSRYKVTGNAWTGMDLNGTDWGRPEPTGVQRTTGGKRPDAQPQKEWADSHEDVNEPVISAARAFSPKQKAPVLGSPFRAEGLRSGGDVSRSPSFERLPSFSDREGSEVVSAAKAFSPKGGGKTRLGSTEKSATQDEEETGAKNGRQSVDGRGHNAHGSAEFEHIAEHVSAASLEASGDSAGAVTSSRVTSAEVAGDVSGETGGQGHGREPGSGVVKPGAKGGTAKEVPSKRVLKEIVWEGNGSEVSHEEGKGVREPVAATGTALPGSEPGSKQKAAPPAMEPKPAVKEPGETPRPKPRRRKPEGNGPVVGNRDSGSPDGLTLLAAQYEDSPPRKVPPSEPSQASRPQQEHVFRPAGDAVRGVDRIREGGRILSPESGARIPKTVHSGANPPVKRSQPKPRSEEVWSEDGGWTGNTMDAPSSPDTLPTGTNSPKKQTQPRPRVLESAPGSPLKAGESPRAPRKPAPKPSNSASEPPPTASLSTGGQTKQQTAPPPAKRPARPPGSEDGAPGSNRPGLGEIGGFENTVTLRPVKTSRPDSSGQDIPRTQPLSPAPSSSPSHVGMFPGLNAAARQSARNTPDDSDHLRMPELSVSPRVAPANRPKPHPVPGAGSTPRAAPRGSHVAPHPPPSDPPRASNAAPGSVPRGSHVVSNLPAGSDTPRSCDAPMTDPYLLSEPYKPSTFGAPARPTSGGRPLTAERPPSADTASRYTYSERPISAERWVAPSESETLTHPPNPPENLPGNHARSFPPELAHVLPFPFSGVPPMLGHVAAPHWPLALGPDSQFVRSSSEGFGAVASLNRNGLFPFLDPYQQLQAQLMQQYPGISFPPPGLGNPYGSPLTKPENPLPAHAYTPSLSHLPAPSQEFPHPQSQPQTGLTQTPFAHLQSNAHPFGSFPNPGLQYPPFSHPYFPYGIPPPFYSPPPSVFPFASASGPLSQGSEAGTSQGGPIAGSFVPPPEPRSASREGLDRSASARSELLKARDTAIQRAQQRASRKEALVPPQPVTKPPEPKAPPPPDLNPLKPASSDPTGRARSLAGSAPRKTSITQNPKPLGPSKVVRSLESTSAKQQPRVVVGSDVVPPVAAPSSRRQQAPNLHTNPLTNPPVNPSTNPQHNRLPNPAPNPPHIPGHPLHAASETLPSYDDFLEFLRFRSALAAQAPGALTSASALAAAFSPAAPHPGSLMEGMQGSANPFGGALTSAVPNARPPAGLPVLPSGASRKAAQAGLLTSATARGRAAADHQKLASAARTIQTLWREHKLLKRERRLREAPERRAGMLLTWRFRARFLHLRRVAVFLQSLRRGVLSRRRFWATRKAVRIIQSGWKLFRASLSGWQRGKLRELRDFYRYVRENLEVVGLEAPSFRSFARLMERLMAATEGARVRRRLRGRKAIALVSEMRDIRDLLRQLEVEKARGGATPDRQLEKTLRVQLRQKHVLLERAAHTPLLSSSPSNVNTPLSSPHPSSAGFGRNQRGFGRNGRGFGPDQSGSGRDLARVGRTSVEPGRNSGGFGRNPEGLGRDQSVPDALRAWASGSVGGHPEERRRSLFENGSGNGRAPRSTFEKNEALAAAYAENSRSSFASSANPSRAFSHQGGATRARAPVAESNRISFRGASIGFGNIPPAVATSRPTDRTGRGRAFVADESAAGMFGQFAGPVFRTFDEGLSLSPVRVNSPPARSRATTAEQADESLRETRPGAAQDATKRGQRKSVRSDEEGWIEFEDVPYESESDGMPDAVEFNRHSLPLNEDRFTDNRPGPRRQGRGAYDVEDLARASASAHRHLPADGSQAAASRQNGSSASRGTAVRLPNRVSYDDIPITASATPRPHPDLHVDVPSRSNPPSQNPSPSENPGRGPAKRPFLRARSGRLGTSFTIPDHLKLSVNETPRGASGDVPSGTTGDAPGGGAGPALDSAELGPSTAPGNLGRSLFADGHRVKRRVKRNPLEGEISILERDEEGEESEEPPKRAFLQRKSKAMPMQKLDWSKVKSLVEARLDPEKFAASCRTGASKKDEPPPLPDYKNVKSRLLAYREPNKKYSSVEEEPSFEPGDQAPSLRLPTSPRRKPGKSAARDLKRSGSEESFDGGKRNGHVAARERTEKVVRNGRGGLEGARKEAWVASDTDSEGRSLGSQNRRPPRKAESRKKHKGDEASTPRRTGRGAAGRLHQEGSEEEPGEDGVASQGELSSTGELLERMYQKLQRDGGVEFSSLFPRRRGGESVIPRLRGDEDMFSDQGNSLYSRLTRESGFDRLELGRLTFVAASDGLKER